jgi:PiT family inorganic phosphate transporter
MLALRQYINDIGNEVKELRTAEERSADRMGNLRNDMYVVSERSGWCRNRARRSSAPTTMTVLANYKKHIDLATKFIPTWVKVAVAMALGLGTMIGWKRIVVTVGEKIGKDHLTYAQGAAAEITAMLTIMTADTAGAAGEYDACAVVGRGGDDGGEPSGIQMATVRNLLMAWVLTLPAAMMLSGFLFWAFRAMAR